MTSDPLTIKYHYLRKLYCFTEKAAYCNQCYGNHISKNSIAKDYLVKIIGYCYHLVNLLKNGNQINELHCILQSGVKKVGFQVLLIIKQNLQLTINIFEIMQKFIVKYFVAGGYEEPILYKQLSLKKD